MTREDKIKYINNKVSDKTLSFGCKITRCGDYYTMLNPYEFFDIKDRIIYHREDENFRSDKISKIGHEVMYGDMVDYLEENNLSVISHKTGCSCCHDETDNLGWIFDLWEHKRKSLEEQSDNCIDYIFNVIKND